MKHSDEHANIRTSDIFECLECLERSAAQSCNFTLQFLNTITPFPTISTLCLLSSQTHATEEPLLERQSQQPAARVPRPRNATSGRSFGARVASNCGALFPDAVAVAAHTEPRTRNPQRRVEFVSRRLFSAVRRSSLW